MDHHEGYIDWDVYQSNQTMIAHNENARGGAVRGSVKHGEALLAGLLRCGHCGAKLLAQYPQRWELMHLKDMRKGTPTGLLTGGSDVRNDAALGTGILDIPAILQAAEKAGIKWFFIEDESPTSEDQIPQSLKYLDSLR